MSFLSIMLNSVVLSFFLTHLVSADAGWVLAADTRSQASQNSPWSSGHMNFPPSARFAFPGPVQPVAVTPIGPNFI